MGVIGGVIGKLLAGLFGGGRNVVAETAAVFRENAEASAQRQAAQRQAALSQYAAEFQIARAGGQAGGFDRVIDGLNRLPRPLLVAATLALFGSAMVNPVWFAQRMQGLALVPEPLWWLMGTIVAFYFGGRFQVKSHAFRRQVAQSAAMVPQVVESIGQLRALRAEARHDSPGAADTGRDADLALAALAGERNAALLAWERAG